MSKFKKGDIIEGLPSADNHYAITKAGTRWIVLNVRSDGERIDILDIKHAAKFKELSPYHSGQNLVDRLMIFDNFSVTAKYFKKIDAIDKPRNNKEAAASILRKNTND